MAKVSLRAYNQEIETMIDRGHLDEAIAHCRHILKAFPKHLETYRLLGKAYLEYKRYPEAADIFSRILVAVPSDFVANVGMSIIRDEENNLDEAIWHMERAFETQPSNAAIQSELQRLYGRREGVAPPRIRMTRGALAHMYVQGELYPQAISEIKSVLKEDPGRNDMQVLLARAYYRSGLKNDAADVASAVLRTNPYNLDANRVLVEILGVDHPESVQTYRQRVVELDPYAAQVTSSVFLSNEVPDAAISLEHLDWNGQPVGMQPDWQATQAISLESNQPQDEQPDWLKGVFGEVPPASTQPGPFNQSASRPVPPFDEAMPSASSAEPLDEIPDFLRQAGWGKSTGTFDESKSPFAETEPADEPPIEQGELPDWVKAMAPQQPVETPDEEELPDWINKIGTSALPVPSESDQPDWMSQSDQPAAQPAEDLPDWLKQLDTPAQATAPAADEEPDWLKGFSSEPEAAASSQGELDWLSQLGQQERQPTRPSEEPSNEFDFLNKPVEPVEETPASASSDVFGGPGVQPEAASVDSSSDDFDFLNPLGSQSTPRGAATEDFDFLNELPDERAESPAATPPEPAQAGPLGMSEEEQDDAFAWLESLAAKQGATEGLLTRPEERLEEEPDWVKQAKGMDSGQPPGEQPPAVQPAGDFEELGKSEQEQDDTFAWLESLAAKQGASEGLLTEPEERKEEAPEWVKQAQTLSDLPQEQPAAQVPEEEQPASLEELGTTEQERDDAFAWLESLAAKQGASEGLLTKPEERPAEEPEWIRQAKDVGEPAFMDDTSAWLRSLDQQETTISQPEETREEQPDWTKEESERSTEEPSLTASAMEQPAPVDEVEMFLQTLEGSAPPSQEVTEEAAPAEEPPLTAPVAEQAAPVDETAAWLDSLPEEEKLHEAEGSSKDDTAVWLMNLDKLEEAKPAAAEAMQPEELPAWMQDIEEQRPSEEGVPASAEISAEAAEATEWMSAIEKEEPQPAPEAAPKIDTGPLPSWLRGLEEEENRTTFGAQEDLPAWLRDESGESVAEPTQVEPTRATDWQPVAAEASQPEVAEPERAAPEPIAPQPEPEAVSPEPVAPPSQPEQVDVVAIIEEKLAVSEQAPPKMEPPARPPKEPVTRKVTGTLTDPILGLARNELSRNNIAGALDNYGRLIKKGRYLEEIIYDLRDASYRYPVDVDIWQSLGDAYMRANRLQDALDAYTKAEELLR